MARTDNLARYRAKRDFTKTPEPAGKKGGKIQYRYLIQKHAATRLHYDFRLELDGVLKSWAVTRGPSLDPNVRRLAVEVEDHPIEYGSFEGTIPKGQYGGGTVMLWDEGTWEPLDDPHKQLKEGKLSFMLHGKRLHGRWTLVRMHGEEKGRHNWLLIKADDEEARIGEQDQLLAKYMRSVKTNRKMEEIANDNDRVWQSKPAPATKAKADDKMPSFVPPQLATLSDSVPQGKDWVHEVKFDGYRVLTHIQDGKLKMLTRTGQDWTEKFAPLPELLKKLPVKSAILDGELVALDDKGVSSFLQLQEALSEGKKSRLQYYVFDLLHLNGENLIPLPLLERKARLKPLLTLKALGKHVFYSEHFAEHGERFLKQLCKLQMEGVVSKQAQAPYRPGRGKIWLKTKCHRRQEFVIGGFTPPTKGGPGIGALLLGYYKDRKLIYAGKVGTGFTVSISVDMRRKLEKTKQKSLPFAAVPADGRRNAIWVKPELVCEVEFSEWTRDGRLRHPSFQGLREDKPAGSITHDEPVPIEEAKTNPEPKPSAAPKGKAMVGGIAISHPDRVIYSDLGITKLQLAEYYFEVAEQILPHIKDRPLSMVRCPEGSQKPCFFQRHIAHGQPHIYNAPITIKGRREPYLMIRDVKGLITLTQWGVIELHPWGCRVDRPDQPDRMIFDLDPDPSVEWKRMIQAAHEIRDRMKELNLVSFLKTTGGKGLHVTVPMMRVHSWTTVKGFARAIAQSMADDSPDRYTATLSKAKRKGRIFVDYLRNELTATAIAPFSARARAGATVATPLNWEELTPVLDPAKFTVETVGERLKRLKKDPWAEFMKIKQKISAEHLRALRIPLK